MRTNDLQIFAFESEALQACAKYDSSFVKCYACVNGQEFWTVCRVGISGNLLFLRDNGQFER